MSLFGWINRRGSARFGRPEEALSRRKRVTLARIAELWRLRYGAPGDLYRFDLIAVEEGGSTSPQIRHIEDAWRGVEKCKSAVLFRTMFGITLVEVIL